MSYPCFLLEPTGDCERTYECGVKVEVEGDSKPPCPCGDGCDWEVSSPIYTRSDTGERTTFGDAPPGAIMNLPHFTERRGPDGQYLICKVPCSNGGHGWHIDGRASNCTEPDDDEHRCWVRHGEPPDLTVDKDGRTCKAGAGSIQTDSWHGFLRGGRLLEVSEC